MKGLKHILRTFCLLGVVLWMISCGERRPEGVLSQEEMVQLMEELYLAEEKINYLALSRDSAKKVFEVMGAKVFENAATTDSTFKRSFDYYMERPRQMEVIYSALVDTLQLREQRAPVNTEQHQ